MWQRDKGDKGMRATIYMPAAFVEEIERERNRLLEMLGASTHSVSLSQLMRDAWKIAKHCKCKGRPKTLLWLEKQGKK